MSNLFRGGIDLAELASAPNNPANGRRKLYVVDSAGTYVLEMRNSSGTTTRFSVEGHTHDKIVNLAENAQDLTDGPGDYPEGVSHMYTTAGGTWSAYYSVLTTRVQDSGAGPGGVQYVTDLDNNALYTRSWLPSDSAWTAFKRLDQPEWTAIQNKPTTFTPSTHTHTEVTPLAADSRLLDDPATDYPVGLSVMPATDDGTDGTFAYDWFKGEVTTVRYFDPDTSTIQADQFLRQGHTVVVRYWSPSTTLWSAFVDPFAWDNLPGKPTTFTPSTHATTHTDGNDDIQNATASQKGLMTSAYASKLNGIDAGAQVNVARHHLMRFFEGGELVASTTGVVPDPVIDAGTIDKLECRVGIASVGADIIVTFVKVASNGTETTIGTVTIAAGSYAGSNTSVSHAVVETDAVRCDITQVGTTTKGSNLVAVAREVY